MWTLNFWLPIHDLKFDGRQVKYNKGYIAIYLQISWQTSGFNEEQRLYVDQYDQDSEKEYICIFQSIFHVQETAKSVLL